MKVIYAFNTTYTFKNGSETKACYLGSDDGFVNYELTVRQPDNATREIKYKMLLHLGFAVGVEQRRIKKELNKVNISELMRTGVRVYE